MEKIKVLIVDDSSFLRKIMKKIMVESGKIEVVGEAANGKEAIEKAAELKPDIITLDINMPIMSGLEALEIIMRENPTPIIMVSSLTTEDAEVTFEALEKGAVEFFPKQTKNFNENIRTIRDELIPKIENIARKKRLFGFPFSSMKGIPRRTVGKRQEEKKIITVQPKRDFTIKEQIKLVVVGSSTGGPNALQTMLTSLPADFPAGMIISQHMPATFTGAFADRMDRFSKVQVKEAKTGDRVEPGVVLITPGGKHMYVKNRPTAPEVIISEEPKTAIYKPSVTVMAKSVAENYPKRTVGVMLTGMGSDGKDGFVEMKKRNRAIIIAQDEESCVVYGMPKAVVDAGIADYVLDIKQIAPTLNRIVRGNKD